MKYFNFCLISVAILVLSAGSVKTELPSSGFQPGETIPNIVLTDSEGNLCNLRDYRGKKVVVNFWATYHAQSRACNVQLHNYLKKNEPGVEFISIALDENRNVVERTLLLDKLGITSQLYVSKENNSKRDKLLKFNDGIRNFLLDESGVIIANNVTANDLKAIF